MAFRNPAITICLYPLCRAVLSGALRETSPGAALSGGVFSNQSRAATGQALLPHDLDAFPLMVLAAVLEPFSAAG